MQEHLDAIRSQMNDHVRFAEKAPGVYQAMTPFFHEDGDMIEVYLEKAGDNGKVRITDHGMTVMRLSYFYDIDTPNKERIFHKILSENQVSEDNGRLFIDAEGPSVYPSMMQFIHTVGKVTNMQQFKREVIKSLFFELLDEFVMEDLAQFSPKKQFYPIDDREDLEVDYSLNDHPKPLYIFGVNNSLKARLTTICCLEYQKGKIPHKSLIVHENFELLNKKDQTRITSAADKQFTDLDDFRKRGKDYILRERAA